MKSPILGAISRLRSSNTAANRLINLFPEMIPEGGKNPAFLSRCPGLTLLTTAGSGPIRGLHKFNGVGYAVSGGSLYKIDTYWEATLIGGVSGTGPVSMADNGTQLFIACNPGGYIYNSSTTAFGAITDPDFPGAVTVGYLDGYFVFNEPNSQKYWVTSLLDGTSIDPLEFASAEASPDKLVSVKIDHREGWLFGEDSVQVVYNSGELDFPLSSIQGAFLETGCSAPYSVAKLDNSLFWLGSDDRGNNIVWRSNGWNGLRVSTHSIEYELDKITDTSDAIGFSYQQEGHSFYVLILPTGGKTFVYDVATQLWHERAAFIDSEFTRHRANCHINFNGKTVVGDYDNGNIYYFDLSNYSDNGNVQKWVRSWRAFPTGQTPLARTIHSELQIDCETGIGLVTGQGTDPQMMLIWSDDGGHTWSNEHWCSMGKIGKRGRVMFRRLGTTNKNRDRVYEISGTDPNKIAIMGAELKATMGSS